jgi:hypothetical protein
LLTVLVQRHSNTDDAATQRRLAVHVNNDIVACPE